MRVISPLKRMLNVINREMICLEKAVSLFLVVKKTKIARRREREVVKRMYRRFFVSICSFTLV